MSVITHLNNLTEFNSLLNAPSKKGKLVVVDFHATWCGPCHAIAPKFEALSKQYRDASFAKVDVDQAADIAKQQRVTAMPTFQFFVNGSKVDELKGANPAALEATIKKYASGGGSGAGGSFPGQGHSLSGSGSAGTAAGSAGPPGDNTFLLKVVLFVVVVSLWYTYGAKPPGQ
ncbi:mitochondrial thioredoxin [Microbotryomycetes sp. JL201]|nr:mitochondrial thioredoxin [Microbotryomycetes sp. JL201]